MKNVLQKFYNTLSNGGLSLALKKSYDYLRFKRAINSRRNGLAVQVATFCDWRVVHGPFVGMQISPSNWWGQTDLASKILGFYEAEVLSTLVNIDKSRYRYFVDLGAADGYYAIGCAYSKLFLDSYAFEMSNQGQKVIRQNAELNSVSDRVHIFGYADENFDQKIPDVALAQTIVLIDIEGGEFDLLNEPLLQKLNKSMLIIELHEFMVNNGAERLAELVTRLQKFYKIAWLKTGARDLSNFDVLAHLNDTDRWLLCSEGRVQLQKWIVCEPLGQ